ncbi:MAG: hypothetical protein IPN98_11175 [Propionivibrio sp.]|nr:hypothetical protein [Propionivibrio sp.]
MPTADEYPKHLAKRLRESLLRARHRPSSTSIRYRCGGACFGKPIGTRQIARSRKTTLKLKPMADAAKSCESRLAPTCTASVCLGATHGFGKKEKVFEVRFRPGYVMVSAFHAQGEGGPAGSMDELPLLMVNPVGADAGHWLQEAPAALKP